MAEDNHPVAAADALASTDYHLALAMDALRMLQDRIEGIAEELEKFFDDQPRFIRSSTGREVGVIVTNQSIQQFVHHIRTHAHTGTEPQ